MACVSDVLLRLARPDTPCRGRQISCDVAEAVEYLHGQLGVLHGDLKAGKSAGGGSATLCRLSAVVSPCYPGSRLPPLHLPPDACPLAPLPPAGNVLLDEGLRACVSDMGLAQVVAQSARTARGCSRVYASPEQLLGQRCTLAADVYSLGILLLLLVTGQPEGARGRWRMPAAPEECPKVRWKVARGSLGLGPACPVPALLPLHGKTALHVVLFSLLATAGGS